MEEADKEEISSKIRRKEKEMKGSVMHTSVDGYRISSLSIASIFPSLNVCERVRVSKREMHAEENWRSQQLANFLTFVMT